MVISTFSLWSTCFLDRVEGQTSAKLPSTRADDALQSPRGLAAISDQFSCVRWMDMNAEDGNFRVREQYDLGLIRMIYERADHK
jgi:hypothetical protein